MSNKKIKQGNICINHFHAAIYRNKVRKGKKMLPYNREKQEVFERDVDYTLGKKYCKSYNNDNIKCVMCLEQNLKFSKTCKK